MTTIEVVAIAVMFIALLALAAYSIHYSRTNVGHLRSFTPVCPNCGREVRATPQNEPEPKARLRDHFKVCVA